MVKDIKLFQIIYYNLMTIFVQNDIFRPVTQNTFERNGTSETQRLVISFMPREQTAISSPSYRPIRFLVVEQRKCTPSPGAVHKISLKSIPYSLSCPSLSLIIQNAPPCHFS